MPPIRNREEDFVGGYKNLSQGIQYPWAFMGDFNEVTNMEEKMVHGPCRFTTSSIKECMELVGLFDTKSMRLLYTWCISKKGITRFIAN